MLFLHSEPSENSNHPTLAGRTGPAVGSYYPPA
eukprot:COSAG01_NODE_130_length_24912_cov_83.574175_16_plen_33_part_00